MSPAVYDAARSRYPAERSADGRPGLHDFVDGPLAAAALSFRNFDLALEALGPSIRQVHALLPGFGMIVFIGVLVDSQTVEIVEFDEDPDYWRLVGDDPVA